MAEKRAARTIWKFPTYVEDRFSLTMPRGAEPLCVQVQDGEDGEVVLWALVDPREPIASHPFRWFGTGRPVEGEGRYIGTVQLMDGSLVFHLFTDGEVDSVGGDLTAENAQSEEPA